MGDIISRIHDDIEDYLIECTRRGIEPKYMIDAYGISLPDCYSPDKFSGPPIIKS